MLKKLALPLRIVGGIFLLFCGALIVASALENPDLESLFGPRWELGLIGLLFGLGGVYAAWLPAWAARPRLAVSLAFWLGLAVLINWSAFSPGIHVLTYQSPSAGSFATLAIIWDILIAWFLYKTFKGFF